MSRYNKPQVHTWKDYLIQSIFVIITTLVIVWFLPHGDRTTFHVEVGQPWPNGRLIAPYNFPILKSEAELQHERDSIQSAYEPFFELMTNVGTQQMNAFHNNFRLYKGIAENHTYRSFVENRLSEVYQQGIIDANDLQVLQLQETRMITIYHGNEASVVPVNKLYTEKSAYEHLFSNTESHGLSRQALQNLDLNQYIKPNLEYDEGRSKALWDEMEQSLSGSSGMMLAGQKIVDRGEIVSEHIAQLLRSYNHAMSGGDSSDSSNLLILLGQSLYVFAVVLCLVLYFDLFRRDYITNVRSVALLVVLVLVFPLITSVLVSHTVLSVYVVPYAMLPVFIRVFMDSRTAFFAHVCTVLLCAISLRFPFEFMATQLVAGLVAIYSMREMAERSQIIRTAALVTLSALVVYLSIDLVHGRSFIDNDSLKRVDYMIYLHIFISGLLLLFAYPLMALLERAFGFISNVTLVELSNINRDLLRQLSETAPGTFQHSMQVANLAAEIAIKIGAKPQLVRTGALYHDIGKMNRPEYFTENQLGGVNPHRMLSNKESAAIILSHVPEGEELADRHQLPRVIRDFISTHHGCGVAKYFYISEKNEHPEADINIKDYTYKGPNPSTTEQAILMMADAVEASARSLAEYTEDSIGQLVDRIIDGQMAEGFFNYCPITFLDIQTAKEVLKGRLRTIYHTRVSYPTLNEEAKEKDEEAQSGSTSK